MIPEPIEEVIKKLYHICRNSQNWGIYADSSLTPSELSELKKN